MTDNIGTWLRSMYDAEIEIVKDSIANEREWSLGTDGTTSDQHHYNAEELKEYLGVLADLREKADTI